MRILLPHDGSAGSRLAARLVAGHPWPSGTSIDVVRVVEPVTTAVGVQEIVLSGPLEGTPGLERLHAEAAAAADELRSPDRDVASAVVVGRPASAIVHRACDTRTDLIVIGSRGRGSIATALLGSVSSEVAATASCPVLVARGERLRRAVIGIDGSPTADTAVETLARAPWTVDMDLDLIAVSPPRVPGPMTMAGGPVALEGWMGAIDAAREDLDRALHEAAERLTDAGRRVTTALVEGRPADALIEGACDRSADVLVVGTHGTTGVARLLLGSVAHNVVVHAPMSVLVIPGWR